MQRPMIGGPGPARGVIQHSGLGGQGGYGGQVVGPQYGARPMVQQGVWRGGQQPPGPPVQRMVRPGGPPQHLGPGGQMRAGQQYGMQPQPQQGKDNIAYNVEHVFKDENGREVRIVKKCSFSLQRIAQVRKMPVEIEGETIWVECVPGGAGDRQVGQFFLVAVILHLIGFPTVTLQDGGDGAIVLNMEDHDEIPKAVVKPP